MAGAIGADGRVDWEKYKELLKGVEWLTYDPPQKKAAFAAKMRHINFFSPRSPWGMGFPCCWAESSRCYIQHCRKAEVQDVKLTQADDWFLKLMQPPEEGDFCPDILRGVFWMQDNVANETILSLESAHWGRPDGKMKDIGLKHAFRNWTTGSSLWGTMLLALKERIWVPLALSPDRKWVCFSFNDFIYLLDENDKLVDPSGKEIPFTPGDDFMRVTWKDGDPSAGIYYQYLLRRVAKKDQDGNLVKLPTYTELLERATRPTVEGACCNFFLCNIGDEQYGDIYDSIDDHQLLIPGPEVDLPWNPQDDKAEVVQDMDMGTIMTL